MSFGRDVDSWFDDGAGSVSPAAAATGADFVGPLASSQQGWAERVLRADFSAAVFEPVANVIRRREAHINDLYRLATLLTLSGDLTGGTSAGFRAIAEARALAEFLAASPDHCLDCLLLGERCEQHWVQLTGERRGPGDSPDQGHGPDDGPDGSAHDRAATGYQPEWRRFGAHGFPSASG